MKKKKRMTGSNVDGLSYRDIESTVGRPETPG